VLLEKKKFKIYEFWLWIVAVLCFLFAVYFYIAGHKNPAFTAISAVFLLFGACVMWVRSRRIQSMSGQPPKGNGEDSA
jgi:hypothetical protein